MCDTKNKSLAKRKPHLYQDNSPPFSVIDSFLYNKFTGFCVFLHSPCWTLVMVLCTMPGWADLELRPTRASHHQGLIWNQPDYVRSAWSLIPTLLHWREAVLGPPAVTFKGTEPWLHTSGTGLSQLVCQHKPKPSCFLRKFSQFPLERHPIKYWSP